MSEVRFTRCQCWYKYVDGTRERCKAICFGEPPREWRWCICPTCQRNLARMESDDLTRSIAFSRWIADRSLHPEHTDVIFHAFGQTGAGAVEGCRW
jgi:hypothetical protein